MQGYFITLEGGEGAGKSTQIKYLAEFLQTQGHDVVTTREPGGTVEAEKIRSLIIESNGTEWTPKAEALLMFAVRQMHVEKLIKPALESGKIVICDRFTDSTRAYQGYGHELGPQIINEIDKTILDGFGPDLTLILDLPVEAGLKRSSNRLNKEQSREDKFENLDKQFHERLRQGFLDIAQQEPDRCVIIDASQSIDEIAKEIAAIVQERMNV